MLTHLISPARIFAAVFLPAICFSAEQRDEDAQEAPSPPMSALVSVERAGQAGILGTPASGSSTEFAATLKCYFLILDIDRRICGWSDPAFTREPGRPGIDGTPWGSLTRIAPGIQYYRGFSGRWAVWGKFAGIAGFEDGISSRSVTWNPQLVFIRTLTDGTTLYGGAGSLYHRTSKTYFPIVGVAWNTNAGHGLSCVAAFPEAYARYRFSEKVALRADYEWDTRVFELAGSNPTVPEGYLLIRDHFPALNVEYTPARKTTVTAGVRWLGNRDVTIFDRHRRELATHDVKAAWAFSLSLLLGS
jgi:hypothetical protein